VSEEELKKVETARKDGFLKFWEDSSKENILNQFYYEHSELRKALEVIEEVSKIVENNFLESRVEDFVCLRKEDYENLKDKLDKVKGE
jgi:hypothetical protein